MRIYKTKSWFYLRVKNVEHGMVAPGNVVFIDILSRSWTYQHVVAIVVLDSGQVGHKQFNAGEFSACFEEME